MGNQIKVWGPEGGKCCSCWGWLLEESLNVPVPLWYMCSIRPECGGNTRVFGHPPPGGRGGPLPGG
jgi:hypothetical protein